MLEYRQAIDTQLAASFARVNDGHLPNHHLDGHAAPRWWRGGAAPGLVAEPGLGPYHPYDGTWQDHGYGRAGTADPAEGCAAEDLRHSHEREGCSQCR